MISILLSACLFGEALKAVKKHLDQEFFKSLTLKFSEESYI
jgi:hypothetical protein